MIGFFVPVVGWTPETGNDAFTKLLLHCDGTDAATSFPDASASGHTVTANGNAQVDTAQSVFGGASALFDGTGDFLTVPDHTDFELGAGEFTIDTRIRFNALPGVSAQATILRKGVASGSTFSFTWELRNTAGVYTLRFQSSTNGTSVTTVLDNAWTPNVDTWYHVAVVRTGTTCRMFIDGTQIGSDQTLSDDFFSGAGTVSIGGTSAGGNPLNGWLDEIRLSKGIARWTGNFTPPTAAYF